MAETDTIKQLRYEPAHLKGKVVRLGNQKVALEERVRPVRNELAGYTSGMAWFGATRSWSARCSGLVVYTAPSLGLPAGYVGRDPGQGDCGNPAPGIKK